LDEVINGLSEGVLYGRSVGRAPQVLALAIDLCQDQLGVPVPSAIGVDQDDGDAEQYRVVSLVLRAELPGGRGHNTSLVVDVGPDCEPRRAVHDDAPLGHVAGDDDGSYDGAVPLAFQVRGMTMPGE
jgi:hypothetical protein